jgi:hypothetical protein
MFKHTFKHTAGLACKQVEVKAGKPYRSYPKGVEVLDVEGIAGFLMRLSTTHD